MPGLPQTWEKWANFTLHSPQVVAARPIGVFFPKIPSDLDSYRKTESSHAISVQRRAADGFLKYETHTPRLGAPASKSPWGEGCEGMEHFRGGPARTYGIDRGKFSSTNVV
jgi:hypothetical protein